MAATSSEARYDTFITTGARQSFHARLSAAAAAPAEIAREMVLNDTVSRGDPTSKYRVEFAVGEVVYASGTQSCRPICYAFDHRR